MLWQHQMFAIGFVACLAMTCGSVSAEQLKIGDGSNWQFVASNWSDSGDAIAGSRSGDGQGLQGYCLAFNKAKAYSDLEAEFSVRMPTGHADLGFIVRAQDPTHYYLIHFPQSGQGYRAQHFWAALSKADGSGYLRFIKLVHVPRVASNPFGITHKARVKVTGNRFQVWVNGHVAFDVTDDSYQSGRVGLAGFASFGHDKVTVTGTEVDAGPWNADVPQVKNWLIPFPQCGGQQGGASVTKAPNGDILCVFGGGDKRWLGRSTDNGKTWTAQEAPANMPGDVQVLKDGRLVSITVAHGTGSWSESNDSGVTWAEPTPITPSGEWPKDPDNISTGWPLQLRDGTLIRFALGRHSTWTDPITKWGAVHCQAFAIRSTDGGKTWSTPTNLDGDSATLGNLDLTEPVGFETSEDGVIMCMIRPIYSPWMWETWSRDGGKTWGPCVRGPFPGYAPSNAVRTKSGVAMFPTRFPGLTMHSTRDDGMTWTHDYIDTSIWAMGTMYEIEDNLVLFVYMDSWRDKLRVQRVRVTDQGLMPEPW